MRHPLLTSCWLQEDGCTKDSGRSSRDRGLGTWLQRLWDQGLGAVGGFRAVRGFGTGGCSPPLQRDDADAVLGFVDSPPPAKPADERDGGYPPPSPWRSRAGTVPVLLSKASHQEVTGCRELEALNKTHLEGTGQGEGLWQPPPAAQGGEPLPRDAPSPAPIPHLPIHTNGMSQRGSSFRNPSPHFQSFTLALWEPGAEREDCHALPPR